MKVLTELKDGLYLVHNGKDTDNQDEKALMAIYDSQVFITDFTINSFFGELKPIGFEPDIDLLEKLNIHSYQRIQ